MPYFMKNQRIEHALFDDLLSKYKDEGIRLFMKVQRGHVR